MPAGSRDFNALSRPLPDAILTRGWRKTATTAVRVGSTCGGAFSSSGKSHRMASVPKMVGVTPYPTRPSPSHCFFHHAGRSYSPEREFSRGSSTNHSTVTLACVGTQETKGWQYEPHSVAGCALWVNCV